MPSPYLTIDLEKIEHNARVIVEQFKHRGIEVTGVTKGVCGQPAIAKAMLAGGITTLGDSRLENLQRLQAAGIDARCVLIRVPPLSAVAEVVETADISLNSEPVVLEALSQAAAGLGRVHEVLLMVELGDLREGLLPTDIIPCVQKTLALPGIRLKGIGTNLACFAGVAPSARNMSTLLELAQEIERRFQITLDWISGVNSSGFELLVSGALPNAINHARVGEAILLGCETLHRRPWPDTFQDAFALYAEVLELKAKPSLPLGERAEDAFGAQPRFEERGIVQRALLNVGREDIDVNGLTPHGEGLTILGASSGYLVLDVTATEKRLEVGDEIAFSLSYGALLAAMTSEYVKKHPMRNPQYRT